MSMNPVSQRQGWGRGDALGTWAPIGSPGGEKDLIRLPAEAEKLAPLAATFIRSRISPKLRGHYGLAASLIGNHGPGQAFLINMNAAGLGESGFARNEFLMGLSRMPVPSAMPAYVTTTDGHRRLPESARRQKKDTSESQDE